MSRRVIEQLHPGHGKAGCLKILRQLSAFLDAELPTDICKEIRKHMGACPNCEVFVTSLRRTVNLCRHSGYHQLSPTAKVRLRAQILKAVGRA
jgi:anti-sigma factor RsiW